MAVKLVRNHSHWGSFLAEVEGDRVVGVRPFERDPDPSELIDAIPDGVHSKSRIAQPMVREGWLFLVMLLTLLVAMTLFPQIVLWLPTQMGYVTG